jgi:hypothetical protein
MVQIVGDRTWVEAVWRLCRDPLPCHCLVLGPHAGQLWAGDKVVLAR